MKKAVVLCSGGLDSSTVMAIAKAEGYDLYALSFEYGQRHRIEMESAARIARHFGAREHRVVRLDLAQFGGSALTGPLGVPKDRSPDEMAHGIPVTYVPARNTIFLAFALAWAEVIEAEAIFIGVNALDYSGYPDCRPEFVEAFENLARLATRSGIENRIKLAIQTPLIRMSKREIVLKGADLGVPFHLTHSCYDPTPAGKACGRCDSCRLRKKGFSEAGVADPIAYDAAGE